MNIKVLAGLCVATFVSLITAPAMAQSWVDEVKFGVLAHDIGFLGHHVENGMDITGEVLFKSPDFLSFLWSPRPAIGASVNTAGATDYVYADLVWNATLVRGVLNPYDGFYIGAGAGGGIHDGNVDVMTPTHKAFGSPVLFHLAAEAGYQITPQYSVEIYFDHLSNANTASHNPGLNNAGARVGFKF